MKVYMVFDCLEWEGDSLVEVFMDKDKADDLAKKLNDEGVSSGVHYVIEEEVTE